MPKIKRTPKHKLCAPYIAFMPKLRRDWLMRNPRRGSVKQKDPKSQFKHLLLPDFGDEECEGFKYMCTQNDLKRLYNPYVVDALIKQHKDYMPQKTRLLYMNCGDYKNWGKQMTILMKRQDAMQALVTGMSTGELSDMSLRQIAEKLNISQGEMQGMIAEMVFTNQESLEDANFQIVERETAEFIKMLAESRSMLSGLLEDIKKEREENGLENRQFLKNHGNLVSQMMNSITTCSQSLRKMLGIDKPTKHYHQIGTEFRDYMTQSYASLLRACAKYLNEQQLEALKVEAREELKKSIHFLKEKSREEGSNADDIIDVELIDERID
jgi:hypothetical protein